MFTHWPKQVTIRDMGLREGIQSEAHVLPTEKKAELIDALLKAGLRHLQITSFAHPTLVPQFADAEELLQRIGHPADVFYWATVPNMRGLERALRTGINGISLPLGVTDGYNIINLQRTIRVALKEYEQVIREALSAGIHITASLSCVFGCPIEGYVSTQQVVDLCHRLQWMGVNALSFGDTTGMGNPRQVRDFFKTITNEFRGLDIITHFHDVRGVAIANILAAMDAGVSIHDCALCGMGGQPSTKRRPYAFGRLGNVCTEDLVSMLEEMGIQTGLNLDRLIEAAKLLEQILGRELPGFVSKAGPVNALWGGGRTYLDYFVSNFNIKYE